MVELLQNETVVLIIMSVIIFLFTQLIKQPIKFLTHKIKNERGRRITNIVVLLIPFLLGVLFEYLYSQYIVFTTFTVVKGITYGSGSIAFYGFVERFFKADTEKKENPYENGDGKLIIDTANTITNDGKFDNTDIDVLKETGEKIKNELVPEKPKKESKKEKSEVDKLWEMIK